MFKGAQKKLFLKFLESKFATMGAFAVMAPKLNELQLAICSVFSLLCNYVTMSQCYTEHVVNI